MGALTLKNATQLCISTTGNQLLCDDEEKHLGKAFSFAMCMKSTDVATATLLHSRSLTDCLQKKCNVVLMTLSQKYGNKYVSRKQENGD